MIKVTADEIINYPDVGRAAVVALLVALPEDEAQLAVNQWKACIGVAATTEELEDAADLAGGHVSDRVEAVAGEVETSEAEIAQVQHAAIMEKVDDGKSPEIAGQRYAPTKRGPSTALQAALILVERCETNDALEEIRPRLNELVGWFRGLDGQHPKKADSLQAAINKKSGQLINGEIKDDAPGAYEFAGRLYRPQDYGDLAKAATEVLKKQAHAAAFAQVKSDLLGAARWLRTVDAKAGDLLEAAVSNTEARLLSPGNVPTIEQDFLSDKPIRSEPQPDPRDKLKGMMTAIVDEFGASGRRFITETLQNMQVQTLGDIADDRVPEFIAAFKPKFDEIPVQ